MDDIFDLMSKRGCQEIVFKYDPNTKLKFILVKHNTSLNSKVNGGTRMRNYKNTEEALKEGIDLAEAMTKKYFLYDLPWGGGKAVVLGDPKRNKDEKMLRALGRAIESFKGEFQTTIDMGLTDKDARIIAQETQFIDSLEPHYRSGCLGPCGTGTGIGVVEGLRVILKEVYGTDSFKGKTVIIQGLGHVGGTIAKILSKENALVYGVEVDDKVANKMKKEVKIEIIPLKNMFDKTCDIFIPCSVGGILDDKTARRIKCKIIGGGANNQLKDGETDKILSKRGIVYIPDFVINGGGVIQCESEYNHKTLKEAHEDVRTRVPKMVKMIFDKAKMTDTTLLDVANKIVKDKINGVSA